jgi:hypothetical protein
MSFQDTLVAVCNREWKRWERQTLGVFPLPQGAIVPSNSNRSKRPDETDYHTGKINGIRSTLGPDRAKKRRATRLYREGVIGDTRAQRIGDIVDHMPILRLYRQRVINTVAVELGQTGYEWATAY